MSAKPWTPASGASLFQAADLETDLVQACASARNIVIKSIAAPTFSLTHGHLTHHFINYRPDTLSFFARQVSNSKALTKAYLRAAGLPTPEGKLFAQDQLEQAWEYAQSLGGRIVVKPLTGSFGRGVTSRIETREHFELAWQRVPENRSIIVERHIDGQDYRLLVIGQRLVATMKREPANVTGDGSSTIADLIARKNTFRETNPFLAKGLIEASEMMNFNLAQSGLDQNSVLEKGHTCQLYPIANIGAGGDSVDVTDQVHPGFQDIAIRATHAIPTMNYGGIDVLAPDISRAPEEQEFSICEINTTPEFGLHHFPSVGQKLDVVGAFLEELFPLARPVPSSEWVPRRLDISIDGDVRVFRDRVARFAVQNACTGRLVQTGQQSFSLYVAAPKNASARMVRRVKTLSGVECKVEDWLGQFPNQFELSD